MKTSTALSLFLAASTASIIGAPGSTDEKTQRPDLNTELRGGYQEWTTEQDVTEEAVKDKLLEKQEKEAADEGVCIPIGEGENCW